MTNSTTAVLPTYSIRQAPEGESAFGPYTIVEQNHATADARWASLSSTRPTERHFDTFAAAKQRIREMLEGQRQDIERELRNLDRVLTNFDTLLPAPEPLQSELEANYTELVEFLAARTQEKEGHFRALAVQVRCVGHRDLVVFSLPSFGPAVRTFSAPAAALLQRALADAGLKVAESWNGAGLTSMSALVTVIETALA